VIGVVLANALMHSILRSSALQQQQQSIECDGLQPAPACELSLRHSASSADSVKADLL